VAEQEPLAPNTFLVRAAPSLLVCRPNGLQYGHLGMEVVMALGTAREEGSAVAFVKPSPLVNPALMELETDAVRIVRLGSLADIRWRIYWRARDLRDWWRDTWYEFRESWVTELKRLLRDEARNPGHPAGLRRALRRWKQRLSGSRGKRPMTPRPYLWRHAIRAPVPVILRAAVAESARRQAEAVGIPPDAPIVTVHAREAGFKRGREVHEKQIKALSRRDDGTRNIRIDSYIPAIDYLVSLGYTVVRLGDPSMCPVSRPGVVDLALDPRRTPELEVYCLLRSEFLLAGESGPAIVTLLTNTPTLTLNATDPVSSFPIRPDWLYTVKRVIDLDTGIPLTLREMASPRYLEAVRDTARFRFLSHPPEEVLEAVREMRAFLANRGVESERQATYKALVARAAEELSPRLRYVRKWAPDKGVMGDGRVASFFVERYLDDATPSREAGEPRRP